MKTCRRGPRNPVAIRPGAIRRPGGREAKMCIKGPPEEDATSARMNDFGKGLKAVGVRDSRIPKPGTRGTQAVGVRTNLSNQVLGRILSHLASHVRKLF